ncbi:AAA family ATPase [Actinoplanes sp. NPDC048988]|uniref:AAA family ATPase n=1 Tax=Actinoplanes sp. NPDC048988 TaxID=3363901 RepID=UPI0037175E20
MTVDPFGPDGRFVGRSALLDRLAELLGTANSVLLVGGAGSGKTTLARRLELPGDRQLFRADTHGWDLESVRTAFGALRSVLEGRDAGAYAEASRQEVHRAAELVAPFTLVIDSADRLLQHTGWCGDFFSELRFLDESMLRSQVSFLLIGGPVLAEYHDRENDNSPPLGTASTVPMTPLPADAVQELIDILPGTRRPSLSEVMDLTGGNAWLTTKLLRELDRGLPVAVAIEELQQTLVRRFTFWEKQLPAEVRRELLQVPRAGRPHAAAPADRRAREKHRLEMKALTVGVLWIDDTGRARVPQLFREWFAGRDPENRVWDVAVSFAPDDEAEARKLVQELEHHRYEVFFAPNEEVQLVQSDPMDNPPGLYQSRTRCELILWTPSYRQRYWQPRWKRRPGLVCFGPHGDLGDGLQPVYRDDDGGLSGLRGAIDDIVGKQR